MSQGQLQDLYAAYPGNPQGVSTSIFNCKKGTLVIDLSVPRLLQKVSEINDNSEYTEVGTGGGISRTLEPDEVDGLTGLYDADDITGINTTDPVVTWADGSGNGADAVQPTSNRRPRWYTNVLNGHAVVRYANNNDGLYAPNFFSSDYNTAFTAIIVYKRNASSTAGRVIIGNVGLGFYLLRSISGITTTLNGFQLTTPSDDCTAWSVETVQYDGAARTIRVNGKKTGYLVESGTLGATSGALSIGIGDDGAGTLYASFSDIALVAIYNAVVSEEELDAVEAGLIEKYGINKQTFGVIGDSIAAQNIFTEDSWPSHSTRTLGINAWAMTNYAVGSALSSATQVDRAIADGITPGMWFFYALGGNDVVTNGATASDVETSMQTACLRLQAAGANVAICTLTPRQTTGYNATRNTINTWLRENFTTFANAVCDFASEATMGPDAASANATYYGDGVHPTDTGAGLLSVVALDVFYKYALKAPRPVALVDAATIVTDAARGNEFRITLGGSNAFANPVNPTDGQRIVYRIKFTGAHTPTWGSEFRGTAGYTATATNGKTDYVEFIRNSTDTKWDFVRATLNL